MSEYRRRTPKKPEHPVREWISDNLRYFMLFGGILVIVVLALLIIKLVSVGLGDGTETQQTTKAETVAVSSADTDKDHMDPENGQKETTKPETEKPVVLPTETPAPAEASEGEMTEEVDSSMFTKLVHTYFEGLSTKNPDMVASCVDSLSEEDRQQVAENTQITSYGDVSVYTCDGLDAKSRIVFVKYFYTMAGTETAIPALTEFYVYDTGNNNWKMASDASDPAIAARIKELSETKEVKELIEEVQNRYNEVMEAHPELQG